VSGAGAEDLIRELARDLDPVEPIPRIRTLTAGVAALWFAAATIGLAVLGLRPDLVEATLQVRGVAAVFAGLGLAGVGGVIAALAMGVPGREVLARGALAVAILGMVVAASIGTLLFATSSPADAPVPFTADLACLTVALLVGLLPAVGVVWFAGRSVPFRPLVLVLAAAAGAASLGAITAHASCPHSEMRHLLVAHALAPAVGVLLLTLPLLVALKRFRQEPSDQRSDSSSSRSPGESGPRP
jgi:hypothetical protein